MTTGTERKTGQEIEVSYGSVRGGRYLVAAGEGGREITPVDTVWRLAFAKENLYRREKSPLQGETAQAVRQAVNTIALEEVFLRSGISAATGFNRFIREQERIR